MAYDRNDRSMGRYGPEYRDDRFGGNYGRQDMRGDRRYGAEGYRGNYRGRGSDWRDRPPADYDYEDRGFLDRAGDEVRSWFGDEEAERRRRWDERYTASDYEGYGPATNAGGRSPYSWGGADYGAGRGAGATSAWGLGAGRDRATWGQDPNYHAWRSRQLEAFDKEYADYLRENQSRFDNEYGQWRDRRRTQRETLNNVQEHQEVIGSDGQHVGTVDKVRGDRIILTKSDQDAKGHHHSIPCSWIESIEDGKVRINRTADDAHRVWKDEERNAFDWGDDGSRADDGASYRRTYSQNI